MSGDTADWAMRPGGSPTTFGWAKTYDAEYLALAALLGAEPATFDRRMLRAAERLGIGVHALA